MLALVTQDRMHRRASGIFSFLYPSWLSHMVVLGHKERCAVLHETGSQPDSFKPPGKKTGLPSVTLSLSLSLPASNDSTCSFQC